MEKKRKNQSIFLIISLIIIVCFFVISSSVSATSKDIKIFYEEVDVTESFKIYENRFSFDDHIKVGIESIANFIEGKYDIKSQKNDIFIYEIVKGDIRLQLKTEFKYTGFLEKVIYTDGSVKVEVKSIADYYINGKHADVIKREIRQNLDERLKRADDKEAYKDFYEELAEVSYANIKNVYSELYSNIPDPEDKDEELYVPLELFLNIFGFEVEVEERAFGDKKINIHDEGVLEARAEEKRKEKIQKIKSEYAFLTEFEDVLNIIEWQILDDESRTNRVLEYMEKNPEFSNEEVIKLFKGEIWYGMTTQQLVAVRGRPNQINATETEKYRYSQWVYGTPPNYKFFYFENNKLTTRQY